MKTRAMANAEAPKDKHGKVWDIEEWKLQHLIRVAASIGILLREKEKVIDQSLRNYRNFVHPKKEMRSQLSIGDAEMRLAVAALDGICDFLGSKSSP